MKKFILGIFVLCCTLPLLSFAANPDSRGKYGSDPILILDRVVSEANEDVKIQQTALDGVTDTQSAYTSSNQYKITNTLDWLRKNINPYLQWAVYI